MTRISGITSGIDTEALVKDMMTGYQSKIDKTEKNKIVLQYKQEAYQGVTKSLSDFYDKYFSVSSKNCITLSSAWNNTIFTSSNSSAVDVKGSSSAIVGNYSVEVSQLATKTTCKLTEKELDGLSKITINNGKEDVEIDLTSAYKDGKLDMNKLASAINTQMSTKGVTASFSTISGGLVIQSKNSGASEQLQVKYETASGAYDAAITQGTDCEYSISDGVNPPYVQKSTSNSVTVDGINFTFKEVTNGKPVKISGESNVEQVKDNIVNFINDYNELITNLNTLVNEKYDSDYLPLIDSERESMTETQIELWEKKSKTGLLSKDSDIKRIIRSLKDTMSSVLGTSLNKIGIESVSSFGDNKNGTYTIDEEKLTKALTNDFDSVKNLFLDSTKVTESVDNDGKPISTVSKNSILEKMKSILYSESISTSGALIKKAGLEKNPSLNSTLKLQIEKYETKLKSLDTWFAKKENLLYKKFANMEKSMTLINNQYSSLSALFGM